VKKFIYILAAASVALVSCSKNNEVNLVAEEDVVIGYMPVANKTATKAPITGTSFSTDSTFGSMAYYVKDGEESLYIKSQKVYYHDEKWYTETAYFWPKNTEATLSFYSYYPYEINSYVSYDSSADYGLKIADYDVDADANRTYDVMLADKQTGLSKTKTENVVEDGVPTQFHHLLSYIKGIEIKTNVKTGKDAYITIDKVSAVSLNHKGTYTTGETWTLDESTVSPDFCEPALKLTTEYQKVDVTSNGYYFVIPQTNTAKVQGLKIEYTVTTGETNEDLEATLYFADIDKMEGKFAMGNAYTFKVTLGLDIIKWEQPSIEKDWATNTYEASVE